MVGWLLRLLILVAGDELPRLLGLLLGSMVLVVVMVAWTVVWALAVITQPGGLWWLADQAPADLKAQHPIVGQPGPGTIVVPAIPIGEAVGHPVEGPVQVGPGRVSDVDTARLAMAAGWAGQDVVIAVAVSMAEDGSRDPRVISPPNKNGSRDYGLWQVNGQWANLAGGLQGLLDPTTNSRVAFFVWSHTTGWLAWCTFDRPACGGNGTGAYRQFLGRAQIAVRQAQGG